MYESNIPAPIVRRLSPILIAAAALFVSALVFAGCGAQGQESQPAQATAPASVTQTVLPAATQPVVGTPTAAGNTPTARGAAGASTATAPAGSPTATVVAGTPTPRPIPTGTPPDPASVLNVYNFFDASNNLVRRDLLPLDNSGTDHALFTIAGPDAVYSTTNVSIIGVLTYDPTYREWNQTWKSDPITGTAAPLLSSKQSNLGGLNGGDLTRTGAPILLARTTSNDGRAHLALFRWNAASKKGEPLKMTTLNGGGEKNALFDADLDVNMSDLDDDGVYEVVADNVKGVRVWKWDGQKYVETEVKR